jgi:hypothetical protein
MLNGAQSPLPASKGPGLNEKILFWASFFTLIAAGMGMSIRTDIMDAWGKEFGFTQLELGEIGGMGLFGFGITIIFFSFFADIVGYGRLMIAAFTLHFLAVVLTLAAPVAYHAMGDHGKEGAYWCLYLGALSFSLANGTCEAVINPLTASLFPTNKTHWLNILHAGWPGGLVLGALTGLLLNQIGGVAWEVKWGIVLLPMLLYGVLMVGRPFPKSEAKASGISLATMALTLLAPLLLFLFAIHALVGSVELGVDTWMINITKTVLANENWALVAFIWTNVLMFGLRFFAGPIVHKISPVGLLFASAIIAALGLVLLGQPLSSWVGGWLFAVTVYGMGKTFFWPTMLGVISERFPRGGALALGVSGGIGMIAAGLLGAPGLGYMQDRFAGSFLRNEDKGTFERIESDDPKQFLSFQPESGLNNAKVGVLNDGGEKLSKDLAASPDDKNLKKLDSWWQDEKRYAEADKPKVNDARVYGGKHTLLWTALIPATMAVCYLLLIIYFRARGGYVAEVLVGHAAKDEEFTGGTAGPGEG